MLTTTKDEDGFVSRREFELMRREMQGLIQRIKDVEGQLRSYTNNAIQQPMSNHSDSSYARSTSPVDIREREQLSCMGARSDGNEDETSPKTLAQNININDTLLDTKSKSIIHFHDDDSHRRLKSSLKESHEGHINHDSYDDGDVMETLKNCSDLEEPMKANTTPTFRPNHSFLSFNLQDSTTRSNTETIHMYAIATMAEATLVESSGVENDEQVVSWKRMKARLFSFISLVLICIQILVLLFVIVELSNTTCAMHADCRIGYYCHTTSDVWQQPRCLECNAPEASEYTSLPCDDLFERVPDWADIEDVDQKVVWFSRNFDPHYNVSLVGDFNEEEVVACLALKHCEETGLARDEIDSYGKDLGHWVLNANRVAPDQIIVFSFIAILFFSMISQDLVEATIEDATLNFLVEQPSFDTRSMSYLVRILRLSLRLRQQVIPVMVGGASISVLIMDYLTAKNILLNFLALNFLLEADNIIAKIFLSSEQRLLIEKVFWKSEAALQFQNVYSTVSTSLAKLFGILLSLSIIVLVNNITRLMAIGKMNSVVWFITLFIQIGVAFNVISNAAKQLVPWKADASLTKLNTEMIRGLISTSFYYIVLISGTSILSSTTSWVEIYQFPFIVAIVALVLFTGMEIGVQSLDDCITNKRYRVATSVALTVVMIIAVAFYNVFIIRILIESGQLENPSGNIE